MSEKKTSLVGSMISDDNTIGQIVVAPEKKEPRSKRINLVITPSLHREAKRKSKQLGISLNECINQLLDQWVNS